LVGKEVVASSDIKVSDVLIIEKVRGVNQGEGVRDVVCIIRIRGFQPTWFS
jgi:hypothetical protein